MNSMWPFLKYVIWIVLFFIFSELLINVNLKSTYNPIGRKDNISQVTVYQAEATKVNGNLFKHLVHGACVSTNKIAKKRHPFCAS